MSEARDAGAEWFRSYPEAMLVEACWAADTYAGQERTHYDTFIEGFQTARAQRDAFLAEKREGAR